MDGVFEEVKNRLGFGCMRFPLTERRDIDMEQVKRMVDLFLERGFNYFDTAHGYLDQRSEGTLRHALSAVIRERAICWRTSCPTASSRRRRTYSPSSRDSWSAVESSISTTI